VVAVDVDHELYAARRAAAPHLRGAAQHARGGPLSCPGRA
jgi:hypothetical protein